MKENRYGADDRKGAKDMRAGCAWDVRGLQEKMNNAMVKVEQPSESDMPFTLPRSIS